MRQEISRFFVLLGCVAFLAACGTANTTEGIRQSFDAGVAAYDAHDYETAFKIFKSLEWKDVAAMRNAGLMLRKGEGVAKDPKAAMVLLGRAADAGMATAASDLGEMLLNGEGGPPDAKAALPWLEEAAEAGHPVAEFNLGTLYEDGTVIPKDLAKARELYKDAAERGVPGAAARLAALPPAGS
jgi:TPR repeat protein